MSISLKRTVKRWLYGSCPGFKGAFPYFGTTMYFPPDCLLFEIAASEGIFEHENLRLLQAALRPNTWAFDIGANIGLMSAPPLLHSEPTLRVVSIEASPRTAAHLARTITRSPYRDRWQLAAKALGATEGEAEFFAATTLDALWEANGQPDVSVVKIDVEGAEAAVLSGGSACLLATRPIVLLEWNRQNPAAHGYPLESLFTHASHLKRDILNVPGLAPVTSQASLRFQTGRSETFLLVPRN